ncbi:MAG: hypothetical protein WDZ51_13125 [Pirellulaceae bacterium]
MSADISDGSAASVSDLGESNPNAPGLTRLGLSLLLLVVVTLPPLLVLLMWWILPQPQEARLPAGVVLHTTDGLPQISVTNRSANAISNVEINLNGAFHHYASLPLEEGEALSVPLAAFARKNGLRFDPEKIELRKIGVYARLSGGARGVLVLQGEEIAAIRNSPSSGQE